MSNDLAVSVGMKNFQKLLTTVSPNVTVNVRGRHAIGKSEGVYQAAKKIFDEFYRTDEWFEILETYGQELPHELRNHTYEKGLPVIERRLSQISEGDIVGLPFMKSSDLLSETTAFKAVDWIMYAIKFPVVLFLDERNRALEGVKQAVFQLTDSKAFYGNKLHERTRIVVAENTGDDYQVNFCDPAEVSRCVTVQLEPSVDEWLTYAKNIGVDPVITDFITSEGKRWLEHTGNFEPDKKYPDRRAWVKFDREARLAGLLEVPANSLLRVMVQSFLGPETGRHFYQFYKNYKRQVSAKDIITDWDSAKVKLTTGKRKDISNATYVELGQKLQEYAEKNEVSDKEAVELAKFMYDAPAEIRTSIWAAFQNNSKSLLRIHKHVKDMITCTLNGSDMNALPRPGSNSIDQSNEKPKKPTKKRARGGRKR